MARRRVGSRRVGSRRFGSKRVVAGFVVIAELVGLTIGASTAALAQTDDTTSDEVSYLAVVDAESGKLDGDTLTLDGLGNRAVWFTDRPERAAGQYSINEMIERFFDEQSSPNAALELAAKDRRGNVTILEISAPKYDLEKDRLTLEASVLDDPATQLDRPDSALNHLVKRHVGKVPKSFGASTLFIDDAPAGGGAAAASAPDAGNVQTVGDVGSVTYTGQLTQNNLSDSWETDCTQVKDPNDNGTFNYVQRKPGDDAVVTDDARVDTQVDANAQVAWVRGNSVEWQHIGSRLATSIKVTVTIWDKSDLTANYKVTVWCAKQPDDAWVVFG